MPKRISKPKRPADVNQWAHTLGNLSTDNPDVAIETELPSKAQISALMSAIGRKGGKIGGKRRLQTMTSRQRTMAAKKAAKARWKKSKTST